MNKTRILRKRGTCDVGFAKSPQTPARGQELAKANSAPLDREFGSPKSCVYTYTIVYTHTV